jgi:hypothetical protein
MNGDSYRLKQSRRKETRPQTALASLREGSIFAIYTVSLLLC